MEVVERGEAVIVENLHVLFIFEVSRDQREPGAVLPPCIVEGDLERDVLVDPFLLQLLRKPLVIERGVGGKKQYGRGARE